MKSLAQVEKSERTPFPYAVPRAEVAATHGSLYHETGAVGDKRTKWRQRGATVNQAELQQMAEERLRDAKALLDGQRWEFAYYTAGYAVECALKSCLLARMIHTAWVFEEKWEAKLCLTHDFRKLIDLAGLRTELNNQLAASAAATAGGPSGGLFGSHWETVIKWKVESRYQAKTEAEAKALYEAITDDPDGVLLWIRNYW